MSMQSPLIQNQNSLHNAINNYIIQGNPLDESTRRKVARIAGIIFCTVLGIAGRYPFVTPAVDFANGDKALEILYGYSACVGLGSLSAWALVRLFLDQITPRVINENEQRNFCSRVMSQTYTLSLAILGISAQLSIAYMGYYYNTSGIFWAIIILLADSGLPAYSMHLCLKQMARKNIIFAKCMGVNTDTGYLHLWKQKERIIAKLHILRKAVIKNSDDLSRIYFQELEQDGIEVNALEYLGQDGIEVKQVEELEQDGIEVNALEYLGQNGIEVRQLADKILGIELPNNSSTSKYCKPYQIPEILFSYVPGIIFPIIGFVLRGKLSYEGAKLVWDNSGFKWFIAGISTVPMSYITFDVTIKTFRSLYQSTLNFLMRKKIKTYANSFYPNLLTFSKIIGIATAAFTYASIAQVSKQFFGTGFTGSVITIGSSANLTAMVLNSQLDFIDWITIPLIKRFGNKQAKKVGKAIDKIDLLIKIVSEADKETMNIFLNSGNN